MTKPELNQDLLDFLKTAMTPFHAVKEMARRLQLAGFERLTEHEPWQLQEQGRYFVIRNDSSIIAFSGIGENLSELGLRMVGAHTDSPCLKIKPQPELVQKGFNQLGVEVYGGALLNPWFDRDLSLAGRVTHTDSQGALRNSLVDFHKAIARVPSLAIHLDREANSARSINAQTDIPLVLGLSSSRASWDFRSLLKDQLSQQGIEAEKILDYEIYCYDTQAPAITGLDEEFIASARLDNLLSCYLGLEALIASTQATPSYPSLLICTDHEEVGSQSAAGAAGNFLAAILSRLCGDSQAMHLCLANSMMISVDNAHGIHPNYVAKYDENHGPLINSGPVIKVNSSQRYATNSETSALFRHLCEQNEVPVQSFVVRSDMGCGSTIGPMTAAKIGVRTIDIGIPTFAMHSIRELAGSRDTQYLYTALTAFFQSTRIPWSSCV